MGMMPHVFAKGSYTGATISMVCVETMVKFMLVYFTGLALYQIRLILPASYQAADLGEV